MSEPAPEPEVQEPDPSTGGAGAGVDASQGGAGAMMSDASTSEQDAGGDLEDAGSVDSGLECMADGTGEALLTLSGSIEASVELDNHYSCAGFGEMGSGANLVLSLPVGGVPGGMVDIGIAVDGLEPGEIAEGLATAVTIDTGVEGDLWTGGNCSLDVYLNERVEAADAGGADDGELYRVAGALYCDDALDTASGGEALTIEELDFISAVSFL